MPIEQLEPPPHLTLPFDLSGVSLLERIFHYMGGAFIYVRNNYWTRLEMARRIHRAARRPSSSLPIGGAGRGRSCQRWVRSPSRAGARRFQLVWVLSDGEEQKLNMIPAREPKQCV